MGAKASRADGADSSACDAERLSIFISRRRGGAVHTVHLPPTLSRGVPGLTEDEWRRTIAAAKRFAINLADNRTGIPVAALRHAAKGELRRAFPCGYCLLDSVNRGNCLGKLLGQKILIEPGMSATHEAIRAVVHKPSAGTRLGCVLGGGTNKHKTDPAPSDLLWMPTQSLPIGAAPRIVETGDLLWRVGLRDGDELLWVNNDEPRDANHAAALLAAADGKVSLIARRKKEYTTLSPAAARGRSGGEVTSTWLSASKPPLATRARPLHVTTVGSGGARAGRRASLEAAVPARRLSPQGRRRKSIMSSCRGGAAAARVGRRASDRLK